MLWRAQWRRPGRQTQRAVGFFNKRGKKERAGRRLLGSGKGEERDRGHGHVQGFGVTPSGHGHDLFSVPGEEGVGQRKAGSGQVLQHPVLEVQNLRILSCVGQLQDVFSVQFLIDEDKVLISIGGKRISPGGRNIETLLSDLNGLDLGESGAGIELFYHGSGGSRSS